MSDKYEYRNVVTFDIYGDAFFVGHTPVRPGDMDDAVSKERSRTVGNAPRRWPIIVPRHALNVKHSLSFEYF